MAFVNGRHPAVWRPETALASACQTLLSSSPDTVNAFVTLLPLDQVEGEPEAWRNAGKMLAAQNRLAFEFSTTRTHMRVRFSWHPKAHGA